MRKAELEIARNQVVLRRQVVEPVPNLNFMGGYQNQLKGAGAPENQAIYQVQIEVPLFVSQPREHPRGAGRRGCR